MLRVLRAKQILKTRADRIESTGVLAWCTGKATHRIVVIPHRVVLSGVTLIDGIAAQSDHTR